MFVIIINNDLYAFNMILNFGKKQLRQFIALLYRKPFMVTSLQQTHFELVVSSFKSTERVTCFSEAQ